MGRSFILAAVSAAVLAGCLPKPKQAYTTEQLAQIGSLEELMRVQAQTMDPLFGKRGQTSFTAAEFQAMVEAGGRMKASAQVLKERFSQGRKPSFATLAEQFAGQAEALAAAAQASDAAKTGQTLGTMKDTCRGCHKEHR